jgi:hypothetical protein
MMGGGFSRLLRLATRRRCVTAVQLGAPGGLARGCPCPTGWKHWAVTVRAGQGAHQQTGVYLGWNTVTSASGIRVVTGCMYEVHHDQYVLRTNRYVQCYSMVP